MSALYPGNALFFNNNELTAIPGVIIESIGVSDPPKPIVESYKRARSHGRAVASAYSDDRPIVIKGKFARNSQSEFERARDTLLSYLYALQGTLRTDVAGAPRQFDCTLEAPDIPQHFGGLADFDLTFNAYDPFGYDVSYTVPAATGKTTSIKDFAVTFGGTAPVQYPIMTFTVASVSGSTTASVLTLTNLNTGQSTTITGLVSAGDVFQINRETGLVYKNGVPVEFGGPVSFAAPGLVYYRLTDSGITSRSISIQPRYRKRYV